jgi:hypothetical protein
MSTKISIWVEDYDGREEDPIASAVSNLQYDGFNVLEWDIEYNVELEK